MVEEKHIQFATINKILAIYPAASHFRNLATTLKIYTKKKVELSLIKVL
jgi:hypothetical protein